MEKISQRIGMAYPRRSFVATIGLTLLLGGAATMCSGPGQAQDSGTTQTKPAVNSGQPLHIVPIQRGQRNRDRGATTPGTTDLSTPGLQLPPGRAGTMISLDFHGTDITNVLKVFATATQMPVVADPAVTGPVTIISPKQVTLDQAFRILQSVLAVRGFTALQQDNIISIVAIDQAVKISQKVNQSQDPNSLDQRNQIMTQVIPLENVDADAIAKELLPLISKGASLVGAAGSNALVVTDSASNVKRIMDLVAALDKTSTRSEMAVYQLHHAEASGIADLINNIYSRITTRGKSTGNGPSPGQPGFNPAGGQGQLQASGGTAAVVAIAETGTNSVIVVASRDTQEQITQTIINRLDDDDANTLSTKLRKIKYADATVIASTVNQALSDAHGALTSGSGGGGGMRGIFGGFGGGFGGFGGGGGGTSANGVTQSSDPFAKVAADARTNSLLITASPEKMVKIDSLIDEMDVNIPTQSTTFVIPLNNAQADDVASALTAAFSTTGNNSIYNPQFSGAIGGNGSKGGSGGGITGHQPIQRRPTTTTTGGRSAIKLPTATVAPPGPPNAPDGGDQGDGSTLANGDSSLPNGIAGVMTPNGFVPTQGTNQSAAGLTRQFGGGGGFGGNRGGGGGFGQGGSASRGTTVGQPLGGPGQNGSFTNLLQLQGNVVVVPSPNGDSVIVTTTPNNYEAIKGIVDALDTIPRQVMIEVIVAEVSLNTDSKLGFNLTSAISGLGGVSGSALLSLPATGFATTTTPDPTQTGLQAVLSSAGHSALIQALGTDSKVKVLATPRVFTANNQPALVDIATQVPYITGQALNTLSSSSVVTNTVDFASIGFTLYVTPRITRDGLVTVDCVEDASDLVTNLTLGSGTNAVTAPEFDDRYTDTTVTVKDGDTAIIGGLIQDRTTLNISKVPVLSDIPVLGQFFRSHEKIRSRVELMIFLTPHVVSTSEEVRAMANKVGAPLINQIEELSQQQPNLHPTLPVKPSTTKPGTVTPPPSSTTPPPAGTGQPLGTKGAGIDPSGKPINTTGGTPGQPGKPPVGNPPSGNPPPTP